MKKNMITKIVLIITMMFLAMSVYGKPTEEQKANIKKQFSDKLSHISIDTINESPIEGLYEAWSGPLVIYVTKDAKYAVSGDILDLKDGQTNITEESRKTVRVSSISKMKDKMIVFAAQKPKYTVSVFTDVDCAYCRKFHSEIEKMNSMGITVRYMAFPRAGIGSDSYKKCQSVWCAKDPKTAFTAAKNGETVEEVICPDKRVDEQFELGMKTGLSGTPTIVLEDGSILPGYFPPDRLLTILEKTKKS